MLRLVEHANGQRWLVCERDGDAWVSAPVKAADPDIVDWGTARDTTDWEPTSVAWALYPAVAKVRIVAETR